MKYFLILFVCVFISCSSDFIPKPIGYLRLSYEKTKPTQTNINVPFSFEISEQTKIHHKKKNWIDIKYPKMKATLMLTYQSIQSDNLFQLFKDAEKLTFKHTIKADEIKLTAFQDAHKKTYGKLYEIIGNVATNLQFYVTDSTKHFLNGSLYFYAKPNYDSLIPAISYIKKDLKHLLKTLKWKD